MVLSDRDIRKRVKGKGLVIRPFRSENVQPSSVDLLLGSEFLVFDTHGQSLIDTKNEIKGLMKKIVVKSGEPLIVHPREFVLGTTREWVELPSDLVGRLEGKSSLGRIGLVIHSTAGYVDPGFAGQLTLEISNLANLPIALYSGMKICQFSLQQMTSPAQYPYGHKKLKSHYMGQKGVTGADTGSIWGRK
ncbi:dCTP deaminase [Candidatus Amesbacteria bacterium RIFCSPHIGHO2_01_FULL_48_32]|uniref:dCTP deaminase, dUMP-forming n=1 Tax=Candidatus Amesbacteria bacterium RIFCSPLOWO2_01_FULL_48_25 TaxID=1797259 RepID=A0A1F4ZBQ5_9BACT|nr:MAG: dCTP deaminase [Candidatus Amesbacteria bacterium RIFCSPHIGHO2_01_FULL_48_32]OGD03641.1 MAG: dCTP deaminase [Candidatus Amesbacteria bacterium RIFCSPLOWO2_01_FULL_48_25]HJZ06013.1 dCTP deaminase [Patescibacteria group bacterium]